MREVGCFLSEPVTFVVFIQPGTISALGPVVGFCFCWLACSIKIIFFNKCRLLYQAGKKNCNLKMILVRGRQSYRSRLIKWLTLENEKKTSVSQDWRHKKEKLHIKVLV